MKFEFETQREVVVGMSTLRRGGAAVSIFVRHTIFWLHRFQSAKPEWSLYRIDHRKILVQFRW